MSIVLGNFLKKNGWIILLCVLLSPNLLLILLRLIHGYYFLAFKSVFYLFVSFYVFVLPVILFPLMKIKYYALIMYPYIVILPIIVFVILIYWQWPTKSIVYVLLTASKTETIEFLNGKYIIIASLLIFLLVTVSLIIFYLPAQFKLPQKSRLSAISFLVLLFLLFVFYKNLQNNDFVLFSKTTFKRFVKETPISLTIKSFKSLRLIHKTRNQETVLSDSFSPLRIANNDKKEIYVLVIGESSRFDHWHINGYYRETSPNADTIRNIISFSKVYSSSVYTNLSVPHMLVPFPGEEDFNIDTIPALIDFFNSAGFLTCWISNQCNRFNAIGSISRRAHKFITLDCKHEVCFDEAILDELDKILQSENKKLFIVLHQMGSHYPYHNRYPKNFKKFMPDLDANKHLIYKLKNKEKLVNSYDNSILYTDYVLGQLIQKINNQQCVSTVIYCSDHGESLYNGSNQGYGRGANDNSKETKHVPMFVWMSNNYIQVHPEKYMAAVNKTSKRIEVKDLYVSMLNMVDFQIDSSVIGGSFFCVDDISD